MRYIYINIYICSMFVLNEGATNFHSAKKDKLITLIPWITLLVIVRESRTKTSITMHLHPLIYDYNMTNSSVTVYNFCNLALHHKVSVTTVRVTFQWNQFDASSSWQHSGRITHRSYYSQMLRMCYSKLCFFWILTA